MEATAAKEFKVILVGESGVGKTSFVVRFSESKFQNVYESTVGVDCKKVSIKVDETPVDLQIWDTAGQERFKSIINRFFRGAHGAIVMYDVTRKETFDEIHWWLKETREHLTGIPIFLDILELGRNFWPDILQQIRNDTQHYTIALMRLHEQVVGNKNDENSQQEVLEELAQDFAEENRLYLFQTSARDDVNVKEVFQKLAEMMLEDAKKAEEPDESTRLYSRSGEDYDVRKIYLSSDHTYTKTKRSCCGQMSQSEPIGRKAHVI